MASIYQQLYDLAVASGLPMDTPVMLTIQWRIGLSMFHPAYLPPQEFMLTIADLQNKFMPHDSGLWEMVVFNTDVLNVRPEVNTDKPRIGSLYRGDKVKVRGAGDWLELVEVNQKPRTGYVAAKFLQAVHSFG